MPGTSLIKPSRATSCCSELSQLAAVSFFAEAEAEAEAEAGESPASNAKAHVNNRAQSEETRACDAMPVTSCVSTKGAAT